MKGAPVTFVVLFLGSVGAGFAGGLAFTSQQISTLNERINFKDDQIADRDSQLNNYRKLQERMDEVERKLTEQQTSLLIEKLKADPSTISVVQPQAEHGPVSDQFIETLKESGWTVFSTDVENVNGENKNLILKPSSSKDEQTLIDALTGANVPYAVEKRTSNPQDVWITVPTYYRDPDPS